MNRSFITTTEIAYEPIRVDLASTKDLVVLNWTAGTKIYLTLEHAEALMLELARVVVESREYVVEARK